MVTDGMVTEEEKEEIFEPISFKKPGKRHRFLFCGMCALVQRSDTM